eukprot:gene7850-1056_t
MRIGIKQLDSTAQRRSSTAQLNSSTAQLNGTAQQLDSTGNWEVKIRVEIIKCDPSTGTNGVFSSETDRPSADRTRRGQYGPVSVLGRSTELDGYKRVQVCTRLHVGNLGSSHRNEEPLIRNHCFKEKPSLCDSTEVDARRLEASDEQGSIDDFVKKVELYRGLVSTVYKAQEKATASPVVNSMNLAKGEYVTELFSYFEDDDCIYLVMEYCEGGDLFKSLLKRGGRLDEQYVSVQIIAPLLRVLEKCHALRVMHRDVLQNPETELQECPSLSATSLVSEGIKPITPKVDIWAVGVLAYELVCGKPPFEVEDEALTAHLIKHSNHMNLPTWTSKLWYDFVKQALMKDPNERPDAASLMNHQWIQSNLQRAICRGVGDSAALEDLLTPLALGNTKKFQGPKRSPCASFLEGQLVELIADTATSSSLNLSVKLTACPPSTMMLTGSSSNRSSVQAQSTGNAVPLFGFKMEEVKRFSMRGPPKFSALTKTLVSASYERPPIERSMSCSTYCKKSSGTSTTAPLTGFQKIPDSDHLSDLIRSDFSNSVPLARLNKDVECMSTQSLPKVSALTKMMLEGGTSNRLSVQAQSTSVMPLAPSKSVGSTATLAKMLLKWSSSSRVSMQKHPANDKSLPPSNSVRSTAFDAPVEMVVDEKVPVMSFTLGLPTRANTSTSLNLSESLAACPPSTMPPSSDIIQTFDPSQSRQPPKLDIMFNRRLIEHSLSETGQEIDTTCQDTLSKEESVDVNPTEGTTPRPPSTDGLTLCNPSDCTSPCTGVLTLCATSTDGITHGLTNGITTDGLTGASTDGLALCTPSTDGITHEPTEGITMCSPRQGTTPCPPSTDGLQLTSRFTYASTDGLTLYTPSDCTSLFTPSTDALTLCTPSDCTSPCTPSTDGLTLCTPSDCTSPCTASTDGLTNASTEGITLCTPMFGTPLCTPSTDAPQLTDAPTDGLTLCTTPADGNSTSTQSQASTPREGGHSCSTVQFGKRAEGDEACPTPHRGSGIKARMMFHLKQQHQASEL